MKVHVSCLLDAKLEELVHFLSSDSIPSLNFRQLFFHVGT
jgi:hypothetical protein